MHTVKLWHGFKHNNAMLAGPLCKPGDNVNNGVPLVAITDVPDKVTPAEVLRKWNKKVKLRRIRDQLAAGRYSYAWADLRKPKKGTECSPST
jgi:hypothetical protein